MSVKIIAEIGINHNGDISICKKMIDNAILAGCDYVKFQKRDPDVCVPEYQKSKLRKTPWGEMTYLEYKWKIELDQDEYNEIDRYCKEKGIGWFASAWDIPSVDFLRQYGAGGITKIPSALITDHKLCKYARDKFECLIISTGMSTEEEIEHCVQTCNPDVIMHTNSTYPTPVKELNLKYRDSKIPRKSLIVSANFNFKYGDNEVIKQKMQNIKNMRLNSQPIKSKTSGSSFKNPSNNFAAKLIEKAGCKGLNIGDAFVSTKHANFLINTNNASASELEELGKKIIERVYNKFNILLEWEIKIIGK